MTVEAVGMGSIHARIAAIQGRFAPPPTVVGARQSTTAASFAASLAQASGLGGLEALSPVLQGSTVSGVPPLGAGDDGVGAEAVQAARRYLGVPYLWGGTDPEQGLDCSGLLQRAFADIGIEIPRVAADQARAGVAVPSMAQARPGDLLAFGSPVDHIGMYVGDGKMIVAPRTGDVVKIQSVYRTPSAIRRVGGEGDGVAASAAVRTGSASAMAGGVPEAYRALFERAAARYDVPASLLTAVAKAESGFDPRAVSPAGAIGLMQIMPATARGLGVDPRDPAQAIDGAARLLARHLESFGSTSLALAAYNAGPGAVQRYGGIPPYPETQQYVRRVLGYAQAAA